MTRAVILSLIMIWALAAPGGALADENSDANRLMVQTVGILKEARAEPDPEKRFELITKVEENLLRVHYCAVLESTSTQTGNRFGTAG